MGFAEICCDVANYMGHFAGKSSNALSSVQKKVKESTKALSPRNLSEKAQKAMFEKLTRTLFKQAEFMMGKITVVF